MHSANRQAGLHETLHTLRLKEHLNTGFSQIFAKKNRRVPQKKTRQLVSSTAITFPSAQFDQNPDPALQNTEYGIPHLCNPCQGLS